MFKKHVQSLGSYQLAVNSANLVTKSNDALFVYTLQAEIISYQFAKEENHVVTLTISHLEPKTQYNIQIQTANKYGKSKNNIEILALTSG